MKITNVSILALFVALSGCIAVPPEEPAETDFASAQPQVLSGGIDDEDEDRREGGGSSSSSGSSGGDDGGGFDDGDDDGSWE